MTLPEEKERVVAAFGEPAVAVAAAGIAAGSELNFDAAGSASLIVRKYRHRSSRAWEFLWTQVLEGPQGPPLEGITVRLEQQQQERAVVSKEVQTPRVQQEKAT